MKTYEFFDYADRPLKSNERHFWKVVFIRDGKESNWPRRAEQQARNDAKARHGCKGLEDEAGTRAMAQDLISQNFDVALVRTIGFYA
jgi:hypothetical protein